MAPRLPRLIDALRRQRAADAWRAAAGAVTTMRTTDLAALGPVARDVAAQARRIADASEARMKRPRMDEDGIARPAQCDWAWRPLPWSAALDPACISGAAGGTTLAPGVTLFHDCPLSEITLRQRRSTDPLAVAPYALSLDALRFDGSFLSLALDLPPDGATTLRTSHIVRVTLTLRRERPAEMFVRLNVRHGPNTEQLVSELSPGNRPDSPVTAEFDLGFQEINPTRLEHAWIDLIFERPAMNRVDIADMTVTRRPRADL
ncbi:DUF6478 family protein [uncultured Jannaschia sp.]|uniref:DUF6478 family protein n=1 Tax=uncultured Jannaschia sp. TaxID=293347 RepID=UPI00260F8E83|nr:DUF6478 family protein [uncultured Jannaschia sp.]